MILYFCRVSLSTPLRRDGHAGARPQATSTQHSVHDHANQFATDAAPGRAIIGATFVRLMPAGEKWNLQPDPPFLFRGMRSSR